jgi:predicted RNA binding protein YcfA (HicA-like mRNA interferase family)
MPSARADEFRRVAGKLGFQQTRQVGSHERWRHADGRAVTIPRHGGGDIGPPLFYRMLKQPGIDQRQFEKLR